ncbi:hypothetical protein CEXT_216761 [Caerostris extrusa]|uniref:Uncharacterized protein n=1 Tax=Caerostris extrusa TaxID=172846 RepID=A0AAV4QA09_CAEEX|nr:hypothetical protein CEXT_216761 [Caerostris extrusa]
METRTRTTINLRQCSVFPDNPELPSFQFARSPGTPSGIGKRERGLREKLEFRNDPLRSGNNGEKTRGGRS